MAETPKKAAFFLRSSAHDDAEAKNSFEAQETSCSEVLQEIGCMEPASVYRERGSTSDPDRPELGRLMQAASDGQIDVVVVRDYSRLSRDAYALLKTLEEWDRLGVAVLTAAHFTPKGEVSG